VLNPACTYAGGIAAGTALPPVTITGTVPAQDAPASVRAQVSVDNPTDAYGNDNSAFLDTSITPLPTDVVATLSDGGFPLVTGQKTVYTILVRNVGTSAATGLTTIHYPAPFPGIVAAGTGWTCTASTVSDPTCTHAGGVAARSALPPVKVIGTVPARGAPAVVRAQVSVDNPTDAYGNDNFAFLDSPLTRFPAPSVILGPACPKVMVMAVRGSGESPQDWTNPAKYISDKYRGAGEVNWDVYARLAAAAAARKATISLDPIMYPADNIWDIVRGFKVYEASVASGAETLLYDMQLTDFKCGGKVRYILTGYSQGAWVIHDALHQMTSAQIGRIIGMALFGDSDFKPLAAIVRDYKLLDLNYGISTAVDPLNLSTPAALIKHAGSWCYPLDMVCQATRVNIAANLVPCLAGSRLLCPHLRYVLGGETKKAAKFLIPFLP
jgi:hypothetical protein